MATRDRPTADQAPSSGTTAGRPARTGATALSRLPRPGRVSLRKSEPVAPEPSAPPAPAPTPAVGKGRPTPKRTQAQAARRRPLVPVDRKAAAREARAKGKAERDRQYQALRTGDERYLPARDRGPVRRWVRDYVDARRNLGEYFLVVSMVMVFSLLLAGRSPTAYLIVTAVLYVIVLVTIADGYILSRMLKRRLNARFGEDKVPRGTVWYGVARAFQLRRTRLPRPVVKRGEYPV